MTPSATRSSSRAASSSLSHSPRTPLSVRLNHLSSTTSQRWPPPAEEYLFHIVAGIVLAQAAKAVPTPAVGQHHLEAQCQLAGFAVAQDRDAAGVGRQIAADLTGPLGPEAEREQSVGLGGRLLQVREDAARLDGHREIHGVDGADMVHAA